MVPVLVGGTTGKLIIAGHGRVAAAVRVGLERVPVVVVKHLTAEQERAFRLADNRLAEMASWDEDALACELFDLGLGGGDPSIEMGDLGFEGVQFDAGAMPAGDLEPEPPPPSGSPQTRNAPPRSGPVAISAVIAASPERIQAGDLWEVGRHRLMCGDATEGPVIQRLLGDVVPDCVLVDPPYSSGQAGGTSVGTDSTVRADFKAVRGDNLSSRGWLALIKAVISALPDPKFVYMFMNWRTWAAAEEMFALFGLSPKNMIVWNKDQPGLGRQWRSQHELVGYYARQVAKISKHTSAIGDVITVPRQGNKHHTTEKPTDLLVQIIRATPFADTWIDPMAGSGSTLIAAEMESVSAFVCEFDVDYCNVALERWANLTGQAPKLLDRVPT